MFTAHSLSTSNLPEAKWIEALVVSKVFAVLNIANLVTTHLMGPKLPHWCWFDLIMRNLARRLWWIILFYYWLLNTYIGGLRNVYLILCRILSVFLTDSLSFFDSALAMLTSNRG